MKPRIQYVYAAWCACWIAEAFTMKRTIATKMIVMSNELRTRGSMPGAIRSEIIMRSSAWEAITTSRSMRLERLSRYRPGLRKSSDHRQRGGEREREWGREDSNLRRL